MMTGPQTVTVEEENDEAFMRSITWCEEDLRRLYPHLVGKSGGFRWFRSHNVVPIERYRGAKGKDR